MGIGPWHAGQMWQLFAGLLFHVWAVATVCHPQGAPLPALLAALVVVDNASSDGTAHYLEGLDDPRLDVLRLETNTGGAGGAAMIAGSWPGGTGAAAGGGACGDGALGGVAAAVREQRWWCHWQRHCK